MKMKHGIAKLCEYESNMELYLEVFNRNPRLLVGQGHVVPVLEERIPNILEAQLLLRCLFTEILH